MESNFLLPILDGDQSLPLIEVALWCWQVGCIEHSDRGVGQSFHVYYNQSPPVSIDHSATEQPWQIHLDPCRISCGTP
jgi:hypothetical protein